MKHRQFRRPLAVSPVRAICTPAVSKVFPRRWYEAHCDPKVTVHTAADRSQQATKPACGIIALSVWSRETEPVRKFEQRHKAQKASA